MSHLAIRSLCAEAENRAAEISRVLDIPLAKNLGSEAQNKVRALAEVDRDQIYLRLPSWSERARLAIDFSAGKLGYRQAEARKNSELLKKATGIQGGSTYSLLDGTAGMGADSVILAALGFQVTALERQPLLAMMLNDALQRAIKEPDSAQYFQHLAFHNADVSVWLKEDDSRQYDVVYLDPMFPERNKSAQVKKPMQLLQALLEEDELDESALLQTALDRAVYRVVVKRPARAPFLGDAKPSHQIVGSNIRFDVYGIRSMRAVVEAG